MNAEGRLIAGICTTQEMPQALTSGVDDLFVSHRDVWKELKNYYFKHRAMPPVSEVNKKFPGLDLEEVTLPVGYLIDELRESFTQRELVKIAKQLGDDVTNGSALLALDKLQQRAGSLAKNAHTARDIDVSDFMAQREHIEVVRERAAAMGGTVGIPTGLKSIDTSYFTGMAGGHLITVIGWPGRGKTWMMGYLAIQAWQRGFKPMIVSLEMSPEVMRDRLYTMMGSGMFSMEEFSRGEINLDTFDEWSGDYFANKTPFIVVSNEGVDEVTPSHVQAKVDQHRPDLVIIDYHQLMSDNAKSKNPVESARNISKQLKSMAIRNNIPVVDVVSATMDNVSDQNGPPMLSQVAWSKQIEYDADHAMAIHRMDEEREDDRVTIEVVCRKNRHGLLYDFFIEADLGHGIITETFD